MITLLSKDPWTFVSIFGITIATVSAWIAQNINPIIAGLTGFFALILIVMGIIEKALIIRAKWREMRRKHKIT